MRSCMRALAGLWSQKSNDSQPSHIDLCGAMLRVMSPHAPRFAISEPSIVLGASDYRASGFDAPGQACVGGASSISIVADIRLDNHDELCTELGLHRTATDDDVLAAAWLRWELNVLDHLMGGFAFACWDSRRQVLLLARDHAGERPLHFARSGGPENGFAFASMPLGLCALPAVGHVVDPAYMVRFLSCITPQTSQTFFRGVERLMPGECLKVTPDGMDVRRYWHPSDTKQIRYRRDADYVDDFRERLDRAVTVRMAGRESVASTLSGGLDSSSVTVTAARLLAAHSRRLTSFTSVPLPEYNGLALPGRFGDEGPAAADVAAMYPNIDHVRVDASGRDILDAAARAARINGEPAFNPTNQLWIDAILDGMRDRGLDVLLQGISGNATISFGGLVGLSDLFRSGRWITLFRRTQQLRSRGYTSWRGAASWATGPVMPDWMRRLFHPEMREFSFTFSPVHPDRTVEYNLKAEALEVFYGAEVSSAAVRRQFYDYYDPGVSNGAVASVWQVEQCDPTHDKNVYEFCFGIPIEQYLVQGQSRSLIRRAMVDRLPEATLRRTTRGLQAADWYLIMGAQRERLAVELRRIERSPMVRHLIDTERLRTLLETWPTQDFHDSKVNEAWHLAVSRGIAAGGFVAEYDPDMPADAKLPQEKAKPGS